MTAIQEYRTMNGAPSRVSQATTIEQSRAVAEVQAAVIVAQNVPRDIQRGIAEMRESCGRMSMAEQAFYSVPNRGNGPSVHLARELARIWGNIEHGSHELHRDDEGGVSEVQAFAWDKQTNTRTSRTFIAPHERSLRGGVRQKLTDLGDIQNNNNNVAARAVRECILNVLPRWFVEDAQNICRRTLEKGEGEPLSDRVERMLKTFKGIGVTERQIEVRLDKKRGQWDAGDVAQMGIVYTSITRDGIDKDEAFPPLEETVADIVGDSTEQPAGESKLKGKVKPASTPKSAEPEDAATPGDTSSNTVDEGIAADAAARERIAERTKPEPETVAAEPPGAPTASTPGQTDRVAKALAKAHRGGIPAAARRALAEEVASLLAEGGCVSDADEIAMFRHVLSLGVGEFAPADVTDTDLKKVRDTVNAWKQLGTLTDMTTQILDAADMNAETQTDAEQQTLEGTEGGQQ